MPYHSTPMSNEAEISRILSEAVQYGIAGGLQIWRAFVPADRLSDQIADEDDEGAYLLGMGEAEWQAKECLNHQVRIACGWERVGDGYVWKSR